MDSNQPGCEVCLILPKIEPELIIVDGEYWLANLRDSDQTLLGTTFITLKRHASELDELTPAEDQEFIVIRNGLIRAIRDSFNPINFNLSCLKNDAFKPDPDNTSPEVAHVHYHLKPRYSPAPKGFADEVFHDPMPGKYLSGFERHKPSRAAALIIAQTIRSHSAF